MYKDVLEMLNKDRRVDDNFIERLEKNGFEVSYDKFCYWDSQPYIQIGKECIWLVETYNAKNNGQGVCYRYRNEVASDISFAIKSEESKLEEETKTIDKILPIK